MRRVRNVLLIALATIAVFVLILVGALQVRSPGKARPILGNDGRPLAGSISEKITVPINGVEQGMFIQGADVRNPVLLFLHGGPGMPTYFLTERYPTGLEEYFTVAWWEQRGAGLSYIPNLDAQNLTAEQLISDTVQVTHYLRERFGQDKIYLMGHSWGSYLGIQTAARAPELFHAYIGVGQVTYQQRSEKVAYDYMLQEYREIGDTRMVRRLEAAPVSLDAPLPAAYITLRDEAMHKLGIGTTREMKSVVSGIFLRSWLFTGYTLAEKINLWRGKIASRAILWDDFIATDLSQKVTQLDLPVYFLHGAYDYTTSYSLAREWFDTLQAPIKGFYTFTDSAHSPIHEEPDRLRAIVQEDILAGTVTHADPR